MESAVNGKCGDIQEGKRHGDIEDAQKRVSDSGKGLFVRFSIELDKEHQGGQWEDQEVEFISQMSDFYKKGKCENRQAQKSTETSQWQHAVKTRKFVKFHLGKAQKQSENKEIGPFTVKGTDDDDTCAYQCCNHPLAKIAVIVDVEP